MSAALRHTTLKLRGVGFGYGAPLIEGADLDVEPGEVVALCGPNGSGKTTLLRLAAGLLEPLLGRVEVGGEPVARLGSLERAKRLSYLPQSPLLPEGWTVAEVMALGDYPHAARPPAPRPLRERMLEAEGRLGLAPLRNRPVETLSGGERRRALLGRTLVQDAPVLVLDEPAGDLDLGHQVALYRHLADLAREGRTVLLSTHDLNLSLLFGHRLHLLDGSGGLRPMPGDSRARRETLEGAFGVPLGEVLWEGTPCYVPRVVGEGGGAASEKEGGAT